MMKLGTILAAATAGMSQDGPDQILGESDMDYQGEVSIFANIGDLIMDKLYVSAKIKKASLHARY